MASLGELANVTGYKPGPALTAAGGVRSATLGPMNVMATMQGANVLAQHLFVLSAIWKPVVMQLTQFFGDLMAEVAKENHLPNWLTGDTYRSIMASEVLPMVNGASIDISVATPQARFLEFGFIHHLSGAWIHNPFMIPAADAVVPMYVDALEQFAAAVGSLRFFSGPASVSQANDTLGSVRNALYSYSKFAGDIQVLGFGGLSASRGLAVKGGKGLGNIQSIQNGAINSRIARLGAGRFGGGSLRGGNFGGSFASGASGRIYNRISGRAFGGALSGI